MAVVVRTENREGTQVLVYDTGLERDAATGRIIRSADHTLITNETAADFHRARKEHKRALVREAANSAVKNKQLVQQYGEDAFIAAVTASAMDKAQDSKDPKSIEASRFLFSESGVGELAEDIDGAGAGSPGNTPRVLLLIAALVGRENG